MRSFGVGSGKAWVGSEQAWQQHNSHIPHLHRLGWVEIGFNSVQALYHAVSVSSTLTASYNDEADGETDVLAVSLQTQRARVLHGSGEVLAAIHCM